MKFKREVLEKQLRESNTFLRAIATDADNYLQREFGKELVITRVYEKLLTGKESGIHEQRLAFDARVLTVLKWYLTMEEASSLVDYLNRKYIRYDKFKTAQVHKTNGSPFHLHVQVSWDMGDYTPKGA